MDKEKMMKTMRDSISNVLETMFYQSVQFTDSKHTLKEWFSGMHPLIGATLSFNGSPPGTFYLIFPVDLVTDITANFLGIDEEEINEGQRIDTVKEALNMIGGHMLSIIDKTGDFKLGIPELTEGDDLMENKLEDLKFDTVFIETEDNRIVSGIMF